MDQIYAGAPPAPVLAEDGSLDAPVPGLDELALLDAPVSVRLARSAARSCVDSPAHRRLSLCDLFLHFLRSLATRLAAAFNSFCSAIMAWICSLSVIVAIVLVATACGRDKQEKRLRQMAPLEMLRIKS